MPFKIIKNKKGSFAVKNMDTGKLKSKHTTLDKAKRQLSLLNMIRFIKHE